jgi:hypothetical protein
MKAKDMFKRFQNGLNIDEILGILVNDSSNLMRLRKATKQEARVAILDEQIKKLKAFLNLTGFIIEDKALIYIKFIYDVSASEVINLPQVRNEIVKK